MNLHLSRKYWLLIAGLVLLVFAWSARPTTAQPPTTHEANATDIQNVLSPQGGGDDRSVHSKISYQGVLTQDGAPLNGTQTLSFTLHVSETCATQALQTIVKQDVAVENGVFSVLLDVDADDVDGQGLWLAVNVTDTQISCQEITPAPYALSLRPGAVVSNTFARAEFNYFGSDSQGGWRTAGVYGSAIELSPSYAEYGVLGESASTGVFGVSGLSTSNISHAAGVIGSSQDNAGVIGYSSGPTVPAVAGYHQGDGPSIYGSGGGAYPAVEGMRTDDGIAVGGYSSAGTGVVGSASANSGVNYGVRGSSYSPDGYAGYFINTSNDGVALYAEGSGTGRDKASLQVDNTEQSHGMAAYLSNNSDFATTHVQNDGSGQVLWLMNGGTDAAGTGGGDFIQALNNDESDVQFRVTTDGSVYADGPYNSPAADMAEMLPAVAGLEPGDVLIIESDGRLARSQAPFQTSVVGVHSTQPAFVGGQPVMGELENHVPLAVVGIVPVKACAENGAIQPGDLLVASSTPGCAMRAGASPPPGSVLGKALAPLSKDSGLIQMLVTLQ